ncbi:MAG: hypothetical protein HC898_12800 [Phycisphaerales bacterium]|nr:hypothetical protein [Phycisphaerales bacterium]
MAGAVWCLSPMPMTGLWRWAYWLPQTDELARLTRLARLRVRSEFSFVKRVRRELDVYDQVMGVEDHSQSHRQAA